MTGLEQYIADIESGKAVVGVWIRKLYLEVLKPIVEGKDPLYYYDKEASADYFEFVFSFCRNTSNKEWYGKPLRYFTWQKAIFDALFGIKVRKTEKRRFKQLFLEVGCKNGKSEMMYPLPLYMMMTNKGIDIACAALDQKQAKILWGKSAKAVRLCDSLEKHVFKVKEYPPYSISTKPETKIGSSFVPLARDNSRDKAGWEGFEYYVTFIDEVHSANSEMKSILAARQSSYDDPIAIEMGTAGRKRSALFDAERKAAKEILLGVMENPNRLDILYEIDYDDLDLIDESSRPSVDDPYNEKCWPKANPCLGITKKVSAIESAMASAKENKEVEIDFLTKHLNVVGAATLGWLPYKYYINRHVYSPEEMAELFDNQVVIGGYDLSKTNDVTCFGTLMFDNKNGFLFFDPMFWITEEFLDSEDGRASGVPWDAWIQQGLVRKSSDAHKIDYRDVTRYLLETFRKHGYTYSEIDYDSWSATYLINDIKEAGWNCQVPVIQGYKSLHQPVDECEALLKSGKLRWNDNPVMTWMLSNVEMVIDRNGNRVPKKVLDDRSRKIDGPAVLFNCLYGYCQNPQRYFSGGNA